MQRAAASSPTTPPSKRQRTSDGRATPRHSTSDLEAMRAAVAAEDAKRQRAVDRRAADQGETRWRLSVREAPRPAAELAVRAASFAELDAPDSSDEEDGEEGRPRKGGSLRVAYGKVRAWGMLRGSGVLTVPQPKERTPKKRPSGADGADDADSADGSSGDESTSEYDPLGVGDLIEKGRAAARASGGRQPSPDHIGFTSISGGKPGAMKCFRCGGPHKKVDCPRGY